MNAFTSPWLEGHTPRDLIRWAGAAAIVIAVHAGAVAYFLSRHAPELIGDDDVIVTVELAPIDSTPDAVQRDEAPAPETMVESKATNQEQQREQPQEAKVEQPPDPTPAIVPLPVTKSPEPVEAALPPAPQTAQQVKGGAPRIEPSWQTSLLRQLQRYKRYPQEAQSRSEQGVVLLSFSVDRRGHVLAHRIKHSSGYRDLDEEVMAMIERAQPLPPFPPGMPQSRLDLTVPIRFSLR